MKLTCNECDEEKTEIRWQDHGEVVKAQVCKNDDCPATT